MVTIKDDCSCCDPYGCDWKQRLKEAYARASVSINKVGDLDGRVYYPDGTGFVKLPIPNLSEIQQISESAQDIAELKDADAQLRAKDEALDADIARIDATDTAQSEQIGDNAERITSTYNDLVATEATVAEHNSKIITLEANNEALAKSLVSDVVMRDGTTAGSVQVSIEREDGTLITSANYRWGRDIGLRLEAGTQEGYVKGIIDLSDGTVIESNEYKIVEVLESDVYVTAITLIADQTAGTLGGNISYSNGTSQTINTVNVPTAPGVTSALEALQTRMTAVEQKNTTQDASISALESRVQAIEDTPGIGQFGAGKLGTIAGSTADGKVKAENDGTGSVNGWGALKQRMTTAEGQIVEAQNDIAGLDTEMSGVVTEINALAPSVSVNAEVDPPTITVGINGKTAQANLPSSNDGWEEININALPTDFSRTDVLRFEFKIRAESNSPMRGDDNRSSFATFRLAGATGSPMNVGIPFLMDGYSGAFNIWFIDTISNFASLNQGNFNLDIDVIRWNGNAWADADYTINKSNFSDYIRHFWRKKE